MDKIILALFYFLFPALIIYLDKKSSIVRKIGPVIICYGMGLLAGNIGIIPVEMKAFKEYFSYGIVFLAIPLLLFSLDIRKWVKIAGKTMISLLLGLVSVLITVVIGYYLYRNVIPEIWQVSGVLVGFYSGGAPNAAAIHLALGMEPEFFILLQTYDLAVGAVTILFLMTVAQRFFLLFMRPYQPVDREDMGNIGEMYHEKYESYDGILKTRTIGPLSGAFALSVLITGIAIGISFLFPGTLEDDIGIIIIVITTLGIGGSFIRRVKNIEKSFQGGMYLILVFCVAIASLADVRMFSLETLPLLYYIILAVPGALLLHGILSRIFNVDVDNFLIISVSLSMSPPFVPVIASALRNREIILPGLVIGMIGYAMGNYLGIAVGYIIRALG